MNARMYDPLTARFLSADPTIPDAEKPMAYHRYLYVYNNPLRYTDPTGYSPEDNDDQDDRSTWDKVVDAFKDFFGIGSDRGDNSGGSSGSSSSGSSSISSCC